MLTGNGPSQRLLPPEKKIGLIGLLACLQRAAYLYRAAMVNTVLGTVEQGAPAPAEFDEDGRAYLRLSVVSTAPMRRRSVINILQGSWWEWIRRDERARVGVVSCDCVLCINISLSPASPKRRPIFHLLPVRVSSYGAHDTNDV